MSILRCLTRARARLARRRLAWAVAGALLFSIAGCGVEIDPESHGELITAPPYLKGIEKPYPLPQLEDPAKDRDSAASPKAPQQ